MFLIKFPRLICQKIPGLLSWERCFVSVTRKLIHFALEKKQDAPEDLFVGLIQPINNTAEEMLQFVALLPNGAECLVESIPIPPKQRLFMAYNTKDKNLYYCFGIREGEGTYPHRGQ